MNRREKPAASGRRARYLLLAALLAGLLATACGKKGPLYLPDDAGGSRATGAPAAVPAPAQAEK